MSTSFRYSQYDTLTAKNYARKGKMLISGSQCEMERLQFIAELDGSKQMCYVTANHNFVWRKMQNKISLVTGYRNCISVLIKNV